MAWMRLFAARRFRCPGWRDRESQKLTGLDITNGEHNISNMCTDSMPFLPL